MSGIEAKVRRMDQLQQHMQTILQSERRKLRDREQSLNCKIAALESRARLLEAVVAACRKAIGEFHDQERDSLYRIMDAVHALDKHDAEVGKCIQKK